ncbi:hypothetical protein Cadr_000017441 [Camelus dromedarius]|uniref:Uncharacterized protein n=1 Tax=Camelus dromedarius TaxID=9838 RepID=A0A5N4DH56_CAMDR|nr:hypothetical protein Cadr_000017441 [Camelus dromedarius]
MGRIPVPTHTLTALPRCWKNKQPVSPLLAKSPGCCCCSICNFSVSKTTGRTRIMKEVVPIHKAALENLQREHEHDGETSADSFTKNKPVAGWPPTQICCFQSSCSFKAPQSHQERTQCLCPLAPAADRTLSGNISVKPHSLSDRVSSSCGRGGAGLGRSSGNDPSTPGHAGPLELGEALTPPAGDASARTFPSSATRLRPDPSARGAHIPAPRPQPHSPLRGGQYLLVVFLFQLLFRLLGIAFRKQFGRRLGRRQPWLRGTPEAEEKRRVQRKRRTELPFREPEAEGLGESAALWPPSAEGLSPWDMPRQVWVLGFAQKRIQEGHKARF